MMKNFESSFFESLVELSAISKADVTALKRAIKRQNPHFVDDVLARNFKGSSDNKHARLAERYAKSFARELSQSAAGKFTFSDRLLKTDLKHDLKDAPALPVMEKQARRKPPELEPTAPKTERSPLKPLNPKSVSAPTTPFRPKKQKDDFEF